jgi:outer membrane protein insertion porin family
MVERRSSLLLALLCWSIFGLFFPPACAQQPGGLQLKVTSITISNIGPQAVSDAMVLANIRVKVGDTFTASAIDDDVRNLYATGYFLNVRVFDKREADGVGLLYVLQGLMKITDLTFTGNKRFTKEELLRKIKTKVGDPLNEQKLFLDTQEIKKLYEKKGYAKTKVDYAVSPDERAGRASVRFEITESQKLRVVNVIFDGAHAFTQKKLRKVVKTRRWWWLSWITSSGTLKDDQLEEDKERLADFYREAGYIDFELKEVVIAPEKNPRKVVVHWVISEGRQYKVGAIGFKGFTLFTTNEVYKNLKMVVGSVFTPSGLRTNVSIIQDMYGSRGYIDTRVLARRVPNTQTGTMDLTFDVDEGDKSYIEKIEIRGNTKTKDIVIRRELSVAPGEVFDMVKVKRSQLRLQGLNYFEEPPNGVDATPESTDIKDRRNLVISVREKNTGNIALGAGFTSIDSLVGFVEVTQANFDLFNPPYFMGGGQRARLRLQIGTERKDFVAAWVQPWFLEQKLELGVEGYYHDYNFVSLNDQYDESILGGKVGLRKALGTEFLIGSVSYTLENVDLTLNPGFHGPQTEVIYNPFPQIIHSPGNVSEEILSQMGSTLVSKFTFGLTYDTRNSYQLPTKGQKTDLRFEVASQSIGSEVNFYSWEIRHARYIKGFFPGHVLELGARTGVLDAFGDTEQTPIFERWFLGGLDSLRGYEYRSVGPEDQFGEPLGGNTYWFGTAEYSLPVIERVRFAVFYDIGMVYTPAYHWNFSSYADDWGVGLRLFLPIGPLRLDYGIPIHNSVGDTGNGRFQFSAGYTRDF